MNSIVILYNRNDAIWADRIVSELFFVTKQHKIRLLDISMAPVDNNSIKELSKNIGDADLVILMITSDFLSSRFFYESEVRIVLGDQKKYIFPIILKACLWQEEELLRKLVVFPRSGEPVTSFKDPSLILNEAANEVKKIFESIKINKINEVTTKDKTEKISNKKQTQEFIFICHCNEDGDFAELVKLKLEKEGFEAWIDIDRLKIGQEWREEIDAAIKKAKAVIVVMSPDARNSEYVTYEWAFAWGTQKKILPLQLKLTQFHPRLESLQYLDFTNREARPWDKLISEIKKS